MSYSTKTICFIAAFFFMLIGSCPLFAGQVVDGPIARKHLQYTVQDILYREDFDKLEKMAKELRETKAMFPDGVWKLEFYYDAFSAPRQKTPEGWMQLITRIEKWRQKYPQSITARVAAATAWSDYGWHARGHGFSNTVTEEGWQLFKERIEKAYNLLDVKIARPEDDCPERHYLLLSIANVQGWSRPNFEAYFHDAVKFEPTYRSFFILKAKYLTPKWNGEEGEWQEFAKDACKLSPEKEGKTIYMRILRSFWPSYDFNSFAQPGFSWSLMKQGFLDVERNYPGSPWNLNSFCKFACIAGDRETARALFKRIGERPYVAAWVGNLPYVKEWDGRKEFEKWREWAGVVGSRDQLTLEKLIRTGDKEEFHQTLQLANEGDQRAQFDIGVHYLQADAGSRDYREAAKWLKKAASQGLPVAQSKLGMLYAAGTGVKLDVKEAFRLNSEAARKGDHEGKLFLAETYFSGKGVPIDVIKAYAWAIQLPEHNEDILRVLKAKLSPREVQKAEGEARTLAEEIAAGQGTTSFIEAKNKPGVLTVPVLEPGKNLLFSRNSDEYSENWYAYGNTMIERVGGETRFVLRNGGLLHKFIYLPYVSDGYVAFVGQASSERINADGAITGLPNISGYLMLSERITSYLRNEPHLLLSEKIPNKWQVLSGVFPVKGKIDKLQMTLEQALRKRVPHNGSAVRFKNLGAYYFTTETEAHNFLENYKKLHQDL